MRLYTPDSLLYPITVTKLLRRPGDDIEQNTPLFTYHYQSVVSVWDKDQREDVEQTATLYADFESEFEGSVLSLDIQRGQVLTARTYVGEIDEPCKHEVQYGGICANCGKDMTTVQYNSTARGTDRATVNTVHGHTQLLVSQEQASRADEEAKRRLLDARKLSLVVDLDQTIIHATVDPTVAEWQRDPSNPNYDAVKDVEAFQLVDDGPGARGCWYYIKLRPGLEDFLETISQFYELHIYTMGTRAYAQNIAKIIDPQHKIFGERILSRDESGSMTAKNLKRLFPVDTKMVVIIDDRGDVWHWSPNLLKVSPYDFFVGIGDINSSFLPKRPELEAKPVKSSKTEQQPAKEVSGDAPKAEPSGAEGKAANGEVSAVDRMVSMAGKQDEGSIKEKAEEQDEQLNAQLQDRPLLQKQKILDAAEEEAKTSPAVEAAGDLLAENGEDGQDSSSAADQHPSKYRHNLLQDDDTELHYLGQSLRNIHTAYFDEYQRKTAGAKGGRIADLRPGPAKKRSLDEFDHIPDAAVIVASMKQRVLAGVHLVFSGVVPLGVDIQTHDTAIWAKSFGASISENITKRTTHVIASPERRTAKVRQAAKKKGRIAIVSQAWLYACFTQWRRVDEEPYRIHSVAPANGGHVEDAEELARFMPSEERADSSPTEEEVPDYWGDINDELADFLGSEADDDDDEDGGSGGGGGESDGESDGGGAGAGSRLQKRKREAAARTSSLTQMAKAPSSHASTPAAATTTAADGDVDDGVDEAATAAEAAEEEEDDSLEAMLAAEMERQSDVE
ncbi:hypothetical protein BDY17DRAFT_274272 [Neohortaea acidophila]|uniref:RNA polymerase II subunit A C-terminal domain phosphatase n=1 Tax=Neohortaea acidophila TaxID=245834 RepID=A0A6A6Q747_9PEZI|nr:uncharacterized protein BDY17DRAFT_274272 [Neohortaea acidophila]KAF2487463.1 hypothetical protein BDY17DRAFT_274272 [Neohortaea acidophila]